MLLAIESANVLWVLGLWDSLANNNAGAYDTTSTVTATIYNPDGTTLATVTMAYVPGTVTVTASGGVVVATSAGGNYLGQLSAAAAFVNATNYLVKIVAVPLAGVAYQYTEEHRIPAQYAA